MTNILDRIVANKLKEIARAKDAVPERDLERRVGEMPTTRDFAGTLTRPGEVAVIAEVKKASPSAGVIRADFDPVAIARTYEQHGAAAISVLTDVDFFQGRLDYLSAVRGAVVCPVLRKDFILDRYQLLEARAAGADAVLLIAECLPDDRLATAAPAGTRTRASDAHRAPRRRPVAARARDRRAQSSASITATFAPS